MATIINERDIQLQSTTPRLLAVPTNYLTIVPTTNTMATTSSGIVPADVTIKSFVTGVITGTVVWSTSPTTAYTTVSGGINILGTSIPIGTSVTVTGTITYLGINYASSTVISRAANSSIISLQQTAANINKSSIGVFTPATVTFSSIVVDGASAPVAYNGRYVVDITTDGTSYSNLYTSVVDQSSYIYTPNVAHKAVRVKLYAAGGTITQLDIKSTTISESGVPGADGSIFYITPSSYVLAKNQNNAFTPANITFSSFIKVGSTTPTTYAGRFKIYENGSGTASYTSISNETSTLYIPTTSCTAIKVELYLAGGTVTKLDEQGITVSTEGAHAISSVLTNESHVLPADSTGVITSYANSGTDLYVYEGGTPLAYNEAGWGTGTYGTWKVVTTVSNITAGTKTDAGTYASFAIASGVASGTDTSSITFTISGYSSIGVPFSLTKIQRFSKSKQGVQGIPGPSDTSNLLKLDSANILTGNTQIQTSGGLRVGTIAWDSVGNLTSGSGVAITAKGIVGATSGTATFTINTSGTATFKGDITGGANINITGTAKFNGNANYPLSNSTAVSINEAHTSINGLVSKGNAGTGIWGNNSNGSGVGVKGTASGSFGIGVVAEGYGGATGLSVIGAMTISSTTLVSNLNADLLDGNHASAFATAASGTAAYNSGRLGGYVDTSWVRIIATDSGSANASGSGFQLNVTVSGVRTRAAGGNQVVIENIPSDRRLKKNINSDYLGLDFINAINPVTFEWKNEDNSYSKKVQHGVIAQDLVEHLIDNDMMISVDDDGYYHVDYNSLLSPIINSIQELTKEIAKLNREIEELKDGKS